MLRVTSLPSFPVRAITLDLDDTLWPFAPIGARIEQNLTQEQLARRSGIRQSNISRIENGTCSPTISTLQQLASGMGKKLHIEFV